jgi:hypothetical protein
MQHVVTGDCLTRTPEGVESIIDLGYLHVRNTARCDKKEPTVGFLGLRGSEIGRGSGKPEGRAA